MEIDIKYIWIEGQRKNALLLSVIDVESRWVLGQLMDWKIRKEQVVKLLKLIFLSYNFPKSVYMRNDNGAQFVSFMVQQFLADYNIQQEFTKPACPEQNAHIEAYHSILESVICRKYSFMDLTEAQQTFNRFVKFYNFERIHSGINYLWPHQYLLNKKIKINLSTNIKNALNCYYLIFNTQFN